MNRENINNACDKAYVIDYKIEFLANAIMYIDLETYHITKNDLVGLGMILNDLQKDIKEVKKLLD